MQCKHLLQKPKKKKKKEQQWTHRLHGIKTNKHIHEYEYEIINSGRQRKKKEQQILFCYNRQCIDCTQHILKLVACVYASL